MTPNSTLQAEPTAAPAPTTPPRPRASVATMTLGTILVALGVIGLLVTLDIEVPLPIVGPIALIAIGLAVTVSALRGERHGGITAIAVGLGFALAIVSLVATVIDVPLRGGVGDHVYAPTSAAQLDSEYRLLAGHLTVDLRDVQFPAGTAELEVSTAFGQVEVLLPPGLSVDVEAHAGAGGVAVFGTRVDGLSADNDRRTDGYGTASQRLDLQVRVGLGEVRVTH